MVQRHLQGLYAMGSVPNSQEKNLPSEPKTHARIPSYNLDQVMQFNSTDQQKNIIIEENKEYSESRSAGSRGNDQYPMDQHRYSGWMKSTSDNYGSLAQ